MRSHPNALLTIDQFAEVLGLNRWRMAGFGVSVPDNDVYYSTPGCCQSTCIQEWTFVENALARSDIHAAIVSAQLKFAAVTRFYPAPKYTEDEDFFPDYAHLPGGKAHSLSHGITLRWSLVSQLGRLTQTSAGTYATADLDLMGLTVMLNNVPTALPSHFEVTATVPAGTVANNVRVYFTEADRMEEAKEDWEIKPLKITVSGTTATIRGPKYLLAKPQLTDKPAAACLNAALGTNYVTEVEVWVDTYDNCDQGVYVWKKNGLCATGFCEDEQVSLCGYIRNSLCSEVDIQPIACNDDGAFTGNYRIPQNRLPDKVTVNYVSGVPLVNGKMNRQIAEIIAVLAAAELSCDLCGCNCTKEKLQLYRHHRTYMKAEGAQSQDKMWGEMVEDKDSPFGWLYGQQLAWSRSRLLDTCQLWSTLS